MLANLKTRAARLGARYHVTPKSGNRKTGPIPVTTSSAKLCPSACPFIDKGCYADGGPLALHWRKVTSGLRGLTWAEFRAVIRGFAINTLWRHNQAGDLPGDGTKLDAVMCAQLANDAKHTRGFTYTHYPVVANRSSTLGPLVSEKTAAHNRRVIETMNAMGGLIVNASANNPAHVDAMRAAGVAGPICTVLPSNAPPSGNESPNGEKIVVCPVTTNRTESCQTCKLCQLTARATIGFPAHGARHKLASITAADGMPLTC